MYAMRSWQKHGLVLEDKEQSPAQVHIRVTAESHVQASTGISGLLLSMGAVDFGGAVSGASAVYATADHAGEPP